MNKTKKIIFGILTVGLSSLFTLFLLEIALRIFSPQSLYTFEQGLFVSDPRIGYRLAKNRRSWHSQPEYSYIIETNSLGFRGPEPRPGAKFKILITGDSFAFGQGVPESDTFTQIIRKHFEKRNIDVDVFNTSVPGYGFINEIGVIKEVLPRYKPHLVLHFFYWNDLSNIKLSSQVLNGYLVMGLTRFDHIRAFLNQNSHLFVFTKSIVYRARTPPSVNDQQASFSRAVMEYAADRLRDMMKTSREGGSAFHLFLVPFRGVGSSHPSWLKAKDKFYGLLRSREILFQDLESHLSGLTPAERKKLAYRFDMHWNKKGHEYFSRPIIRYIENIVCKRGCE